MSTAAQTSAPTSSESVASPKPAKGKRGRKPKNPDENATSNAKSAPTHPLFANMVKEAVAALNEKKGSSRSAILKYIVQNFSVGENISKVNARVRGALKKGVESKMLIQVKGSGASGSFKLGEAAKAKAKPAPKKEKKHPAKKAVGEKLPVKKKKIPKKMPKVTVKMTASKEKSESKKKSAKKDSVKKLASSVTPTKPPKAKASPKKPKEAKVPKKVTQKPATKVVSKKKAA